MILNVEIREFRQIEPIIITLYFINILYLSHPCKFKKHEKK